MNYGMRCHDLCAKSDLDTVIRKLKENNINQIQLALAKSIAEYDFSYGHYSPGFAHMIADRFKEANVHIAVLGCYINPTNPDENKRKQEVAKFIEHLKYAKILGADMVGTETGRYDKNLKLNPFTYEEGCYQLLLKSMREIVSAAEKLGVTVGVEGVKTHTLYSPEMMKRFLEDIDSPNVEVILDPINLLDENNYTEQDKIIDKAFEYYGDKISVLHMKDCKLEDNELKFEHIGDGLFKYESVLTHIKKDKPYITMLLENSNEGRYHSDVKYLQDIYDRCEV